MLGLFLFLGWVGLFVVVCVVVCGEFFYGHIEICTGILQVGEGLARLPDVPGHFGLLRYGTA